MQRQVSRCCSTHSHLLHHECRRGREADACLVLDVSSLPRGLCLQGTDARRVAVAQVHGDWGSVAADHVDGGRLWTGVVAVPQIRRLRHQRQLRRQLRQRVIREAGTWRQLRVQSVLRGRRRGERSRGSRAGGSGRATHDQLDGDCRHRRRHQVSRRWMACRRHLLGKGYASSPFLPFFPSSLLPPSPLFARPAILALSSLIATPAAEVVSCARFLDFFPDSTPFDAHPALNARFRSLPPFDHVTSHPRSCTRFPFA